MNVERLKDLANTFQHHTPDDIDYDDEREVDEYIYVLRASEARYCGVEDGSRLVEVVSYEHNIHNWEVRECNGNTTVIW